MKENIPTIGPGMITLDKNGRIIFLVGGFPGSEIVTETGNVFPVEE